MDNLLKDKILNNLEKINSEIDIVLTEYKPNKEDQEAKDFFTKLGMLNENYEKILIVNKDLIEIGSIYIKKEINEEDLNLIIEIYEWFKIENQESYIKIVKYIKKISSVNNLNIKYFNYYNQKI